MSDHLRLRQHPLKGRCVYTLRSIAQGEVIESVPVIVIPAEQWDDIEKTVLYNYCFSWGPALEHAAIALGFGSLYAHSYAPNAEYRKRWEDGLIDFIALEDIASGQEITVNYNGDPRSDDPVWFEVR